MNTLHVNPGHEDSDTEGFLMALHRPTAATSQRYEFSKTEPGGAFLRHLTSYAASFH